jgi:hypothetical protein
MKRPLPLKQIGAFGNPKRLFFGDMEVREQAPRGPGGAPLTGQCFSDIVTGPITLSWNPPGRWVSPPSFLPEKSLCGSLLPWEKRATL